MIEEHQLFGLPSEEEIQEQKEKDGVYFIEHYTMINKLARICGEPY
jgi:hypothetical protein